jgi:hypothetical protein
MVIGIKGRCSTALPSNIASTRSLPVMMKSSRPRRCPGRVGQRAHHACAPVVQALGEEPGVRHVGRSRDGLAEFADDDLATDQEDAHDAAALTSARTNSGLVPQQPPRNDAPAAISAGRWLANVSAVMV